MRQWKRFAGLGVGLGMLAIASGCSHAPTKASETQDQAWERAQVEIDYFLGHAHRKLTIDVKDSKVQAQTFFDGKPLKQTTLDVSHYQAFLDHLSAFVEGRRQKAPSDVTRDPAECRAPYTITVKNPKDTVKIEGCRMRDQGSFSRLIQEGEFLMYRQGVSGTAK